MATKDDLCNMALDLLGEGKVEEAIAMFNESLALDPDYVDALHGLAMAYVSSESYNDAITVGKRICELTPDDVLAHMSLSTFFQRQGKTVQAQHENGTAAQLLGRERRVTGQDDKS